MCSDFFDADFFDAVHLHLPRWERSCIYVPLQGSEVRDEVVSRPDPSGEDVVSNEDSSHCFAFEPLSLRVRLGQEVDDGSEANF